MRTGRAFAFLQCAKHLYYCRVPQVSPLRPVKQGSLQFSKLLLNEAEGAISPGFGDYGDTRVRFSLIENEERTRQAIRGIKAMLAKARAILLPIL